MMFTHVFSLVGFVLSASVLVASAPTALLGSHTNEIGLRCPGASCISALNILSLVTKLQDDVRNTLDLLDTCEQTGSNPAPHFIKLATLVETCKGAVVALQVDSTVTNAVIQAQVSDITASIILDVSTECGKFKNVRINGFAYVDLCTKIDIALKGLCVTLNGLLNGCLKLISTICLSKSILLSNVDFKLCLSLFSSIGLWW